MSNRSVWYQVGVALRRLLGLDRLGSRSTRLPTPGPSHTARQGSQTTRERESPGQFGDGATEDVSPTLLGTAALGYAPNMDGDPDPGEIVWTWVPYVEHDGRGKDRPVLIIGRLDASSVIGCYVSTKEHRNFISVGTGAWDGQGRESFVAPERILKVTHSGMRREGATLDEPQFAKALRGILAFHNHSV